MSDDRPHRTRWEQLPDAVRNAVQQQLRDTVIAVVTPQGGFTHGMAALLELASGRTVFAKAIECADPLAAMYRAESATVAGLPVRTPTPRPLGTLEADGWLVLLFEAVAGRHPRLDDPAELSTVLRTVEELAEVLTPNPLPDAPTIEHAYGVAFTGWRGFAEHGPPTDLDEWSLRNLDRLADLEAGWCPPATGNTLLHTDLRPDNMLIRSDGRVLVVDWAWPCHGAAWVDLVLLGPSMLAAGVDPEPIFAAHPLTADVDPAAILAMMCAMYGFWARNSRQPAPPKSPGLRAYQAWHADLTRDWLKRRL
ncbi:MULTISPECIES: phosphotransferase [unclassified Nocardia]|uniref:phosphotransferase n=1 Tax=unclassified Nocardia TaxID=2637762 RepID=UPI001CE4B0B5|nr:MULTISPECIES: phosphotransferase [unclassified Nocardia]